MEEEIEESDSDGAGVEPLETAVAPPSLPQIVAEQIYGWRWPLSEVDRAAEQ